MRAPALFLLTLTILIGAAAIGPATAQSIEHDVSRRLVEIRPTFKGTELLFFGSISPEAAPDTIDPGRPLDVIVVIKGPPRSFAVRRKERVFGLWLNRQGRKFADVPGFYFLASTRSLSEIATPELLARYGIGSSYWDLVDPEMPDMEMPIPLAAPAPLGAETGEDADDTARPRERPAATDPYLPPVSSAPDAYEDPFRHALRDALTQSKSLVEIEGSVEFVGAHLFRTEINMPATVPQGIYGAEVYLLQDFAVVDAQYSVIAVDKKGLERTITELADEHAISYGVICVVLAVFAGWLSAFVMRRV